MSVTRSSCATIPALTLVLAATAYAPATTLAQAAPDLPTGDGASLQYVTAPHGNEARYRVREQLLGFDFRTDAVGVTSRITGTVELDGQGRIVPDGSRIVVGLSTLTSDSERRDNFIRRRTLETEGYPEAVFVPRQIQGLAAPIAEGEDVAFRILGDMTVRETTRPVTWNVTARREGDTVVGTATTRFPFSHFDLEIPRVRSVLSVDDDIRLEYDFRFEPARSSP